MSGAMTAWDGVVSAALVGTARRAPEPPPIAGALGDALGALPWSDPDSALLDAAAIYAAWEGAGVRPASLPEPPPPAPTETAPYCSPAADAVLEACWRRSTPDLEDEWLATAAARGVLVPPERLFVLLELATTMRERRPLVLAAGGARVRWLAAMEPRWAWAAGADLDPSATWGTGTRDQRALLLGEVRGGDPAAGRALVESTWVRDPAADRTAFVRLLTTGLGPDDEAFLERALDDRARSVRQAAASVLARLPGSAFSARMGARVRACARAEGSSPRPRPGESPAVDAAQRDPGRGDGAPQRLAVEPPVLDTAAERDGLTEAGAPRGTSRSAHLVRQLAAAAPLAAWTGVSGAEPADTVALTRGADFEAALRAGWREAVAREDDAAWAVALARAGVDAAFAGELPVKAANAAIRSLAADPASAAAVAEHVRVALDAPTSFGCSTRSPPARAPVAHRRAQPRAALHLDARDHAHAVLAPVALAASALADLDLRQAIARELQ
jgi:hypothetical protein